MYKATVNNQHELEIAGSSVNGSKRNLDISPLGNGKFHIILDNQSYNASVIEFDQRAKTVVLDINGQEFSVILEDDFDLMLESMGMDKDAGATVSEVTSPMPGLVLDVQVKVGDSVEKDQALLVLEAMKMENVIAAPNDGVIAGVEVKAQDKVDKNQVLIRFE
ncbi:biotin/lipoyl-binding protein [bacterium]|nr:biotin/lipoyl-binding protein [bacterium]